MLEGLIAGFFRGRLNEDLLRLAFFYKKYVSENFRFLLVGRAGGLAARAIRASNCCACLPCIRKYNYRQ